MKIRDNGYFNHMFNHKNSPIKERYSFVQVFRKIILFVNSQVLNEEMIKKTIACVARYCCVAKRIYTTKKLYIHNVFFIFKAEFSKCKLCFVSSSTEYL